MTVAEDHFETFVDVLAEVVVLGVEDADMEGAARGKRLLTDFRLVAKDVSLHMRLRQAAKSNSSISSKEKRRKATDGASKSSRVRGGSSGAGGASQKSTGDSFRADIRAWGTPRALYRDSWRGLMCAKVNCDREYNERHPRPGGTWASLAGGNS